MLCASRCAAAESIATSDEKTFPSALVKQLNDEVERILKANNLPSVVVSIVVPKLGEYTVARGQANIVQGTARQLDQSFRIASITKTFTATAVLQLVDQQKIATSDVIVKWFPKFPNADKITVDDLLRMRSGIADFADDTFLADYYHDPLMKLTAAEIIQISADKAKDFTPPNQQTKYCNTNYVLLEEIVRQVADLPLGEKITHDVLRPLRMNASLYPTDTQLPSMLRGYGWNTQSKVFDDRTVLNPDLAGGAGAMISSVRDLQTYVRALYRGELLKPVTQQARLKMNSMQGQPDFIQYGAGIARFGPFDGHNGTIVGFSSEMWYLPEHDATVIIDVNRLDADDQSQSTELFLKLTKLVFPEQVPW